MAEYQLYDAAPGDAATVSTELTWLNTVAMLLATFGITAPEATATNPAINAYSIRS